MICDIGESRCSTRGVSWAVIGQFVGQRSLSTTADVYTHVMTDGREVDYAELLV
jgi:hypothetical protein